MVSANLVPAEWVYGQYDSYVLSRNGHMIGIVHPAGFVFAAGEGVIANDFQFISCRNVGSSVSAVCAIIPHSIQKMETNVVFECTRVLYRCIHFCEETNKIYHLYHTWNPTISPYLLLLHCIMVYKSLRLFVFNMFSKSMIMKEDKNCHFRFFNQMSGHFFPQWKIRPLFATKDGVKYHQCSIKPDKWYKAPLNIHEKKKHPRLKLPRNEPMPGVSYTQEKIKQAINCGRL